MQHYRKSFISVAVVLLCVLLGLLSLPINAVTYSDMGNGFSWGGEGDGSASFANGNITLTVGGAISKKSHTIYLRNDSNSEVNISFTFSIDSYNAFTINGSTPSGSTFSVTLPAYGNVKIYVQSDRLWSTSNLTLSQFEVTKVAEKSNVTIDYDSTFGSVTADGTSIAPGSVKENVTEADGTTLNATPSSGATFYGWINSNTHMLLSTEAQYVIHPIGDTSIEAVFLGNGASYYAVGGQTMQTWKNGLLSLTRNTYYTVTETYIFDNLKDALDFANNSSAAKVVLPLCNVTVPAGNYTIPIGVTLLIPFDSANTMYTTAAQASGSWAKPTAYRTMTLAKDAHLVVNGAISISGQHTYAAGGSTVGGAPTGKVGFISMNAGSTITVNSGGNVYAYGYVTGDGTVTVNNGGTVYELFQFSDFRGGSQTTSMKNKVFPLSQYYVQNIEVTTTYYTGATVNCYSTIYMSSTQFGVTPTFIGSGSTGMFLLNTGAHAVKEYDGSTDRLKLALYGNASLGSVTMTLQGTTVNSADYVMPLQSNISLSLHPVKEGEESTVTVGQDMSLLPGSEVYVDSGVTLTATANVYIYDLEQWGGYCGSGNKKLIPIAYAPSRTKTRTEADLKDAMICVNGILDASAGNLYTTSSGANIYSTGNGRVVTTPGTGTVTYQLVQNGDPEYPSISITPAILQNGDTRKTATVETAGVPAGTTFYYHPEHQRWIPVPHDAGTDKQICACGLTNYSFRYSNQIGWDGTKTMWYLKSNLYVQLGDKILDHAALSALDYGVFFMTETEWTNYKNAYADANSLTKPSIAIMKEAGKEYKKDVAASVADGDKGAMVTAELQEYFLTSKLEDENIYVLFYIVDKDSNGNPLHCFGQVMTRNLKALANTAYNDTTGRFDDEKSIYEVMIGVLQTVEEHQSTFTSIPAMPSYMSAAPSVGYFGPTSNAGLAVKHSASVVLIEPWGLRLNGYISGSFDDYGLVILNDRDREYRYEMPSPQQLMANPDAQVYSVSDGSAAVNFGVDIGTGSFTQITTDYIGDLRTYELGNNIYVAFFVKDGGNYRFGEVQKYNVYLLCRQALAMDLPESEKAVYLAMIDMFHKVSDYRK